MNRGAGRAVQADEALAAAARSAGLASSAELAIVRVADSDELVAASVWARSAVVAAELEGTRLANAAAPGIRELAPGDAPAAIREAAGRVGANAILIAPAGDSAWIELYRRAPFDDAARAAALLAAEHVALTLEPAGARQDSDALEVAGDALAAASDEHELADHVVRLALATTGATRCVLWRLEAGTAPTLLAAGGVSDAAAGRTVVLPLGEPPVAELELVLEDPAAVDALAPLAARAAVALRRAHRAAVAEQDLVRAETIVEVLSQAIARLSLSHTLDTAVERISELSGSDRVGVYLRTGDGLEAAASQGLAGPHATVTGRLLELALGPHRSRGFLVASDLRSDARLAGLEPELAECGLGRALVVPLVGVDDVIGVLAVYEAEARPHEPGEETLPIALSAQLAVAVQNAQLHEETKQLGAGLERSLESERASARRLRGLFEISDASARSLSFDETLEAIARSMVDVFELAAAAIRMPALHRNGDQLRAFHLGEPALEGPVRALLERGDPALVEPFLAQGASYLELPLATPVEELGTLTLLRLDPENPFDSETIEAARVVAAQAALALDNARLHQQQKDFAETMQRSLLPVDPPAAGGIEIGHVYESSARVDVGGDVYDVLRLEDGRLAVCLGDVAGKGIQAVADMAMTKYAFRALARSHPEPAAFLTQVNDVVVEEIAPGKFVTMVYALVDPAAGEIACASAGHPPPRLVSREGAVSALGTSGLALGVEPGQAYPEERAQLEPGSTVVLFTDGLTECRRDGDLYGEARLDAFLAANARLEPQALADALLEDCRAFGGGELDDDCAVVCLRRSVG